MLKVISRLQYITCQEIDKPASQQALEFCAGGGDWVQLNMNNRPEDYILEEALKCNSICQTYGATLIIDNDPLLAQKIDADGVFLKKGGMSVSDARKTLGHHKIIGAAAGSMDDIKQLVELGVDYISLKPHTDLLLSINDYIGILKDSKAQNIRTPIIATGDFSTEDFSRLFENGVHGIATQLDKQENIGTETLNLLTAIGKAHSSNYMKK